MSILNRDAVVLTLKRTVSPLFALMSVAKPCSVLSPDPATSHSELGAPVCAFSQTIGFGLHCAATREPPEWSRSTKDAAPSVQYMKTDRTVVRGSVIVGCNLNRSAVFAHRHVRL